MARSNLSFSIGRVDSLAEEIERFVPMDNLIATSFRADLAGLLVVGIAAAYETCVKEAIIGYAARHHQMFAQYASARYEKLSSRISISDLHSYAKTFDPAINIKFNAVLAKKADIIMSRTGRDIRTSYEQILSWRHDYAHAGRKNTTVEEAILTHTFAKRVIFAFDESFD